MQEKRLAPTKLSQQLYFFRNSRVFTFRLNPHRNSAHPNNATISVNGIDIHQNTEKRGVPLTIHVPSSNFVRNSWLPITAATAVAGRKRTVIVAMIFITRESCNISIESLSVTTLNATLIALSTLFDRLSSRILVEQKSDRRYVRLDMSCVVRCVDANMMLMPEDPFLEGKRRLQSSDLIPSTNNRHDSTASPR